METRSGRSSNRNWNTERATPPSVTNFRSRFMPRNTRTRIAPALLSPSWATRLKAAGVERTPRGWEKTSDHAPIWVELKS